MADNYRFLALTLLVSVAVACSPQEKTPPPHPTREAIDFQRVNVDKAPIHAAPDAASPVIDHYPAGETVSILSVRGGWAEVRLGRGGSGWILRDQMGEQVKTSEESSTPQSVRFRVLPQPVFAQSEVHGDIVLEAHVNEQGNVYEVHVVSDSTGSPALVDQNMKELRAAKFYPMRVNGRAKPFIYEHTVHY
ncbi:MAG: SH3 domain-containing protein [Thermoanaerobaculia bacterium]